MKTSYRDLFPVFEGDPDLVYLDSAATTHKPKVVIESIAHQLAHENGSPHRGAHRSSVKATQLYHEAKVKVASFIGAESADEIVFTKNATEALNLIAYTYGLDVGESLGGNIVIAITSHHSNIVPWQMVSRKTGMMLKYLYLDDAGDFTTDSLSAIDDETRIVAFPVISNAYGKIHRIKELIDRAHAHGAVAVVDGAQAVGHMHVDVQKWDADFLVFSGHKVYGPQGIGVLYGKKELLDGMSPFLGGGDMIEYVTEQVTTFAATPLKLEAGTQNVTGAHGLRVAIEFMEDIGIDRIAEHEEGLISYALERFKDMPYIKVIGPTDPEARGSLITFMVDGIHPHDVASLLDARGIAIRAGHHCCQPLMQTLEIPASCRVSFAIYNTNADVDALVEGLKHVREVFGHVE